MKLIKSVTLVVIVLLSVTGLLSHKDSPKQKATSLYTVAPEVQKRAGPKKPVQPSKASKASKAAQTEFLKARVLKVVDGDTVDVSLNGKVERVRVIGVDTPETKHPTKPVQPYGPEAATFTQNQLTGQTVFLETDVGQRDQYSRLLAYIWLNEPKTFGAQEIKGNMFNARLLECGYAQVMTVPPNVKYVDYFVQLQREARVAEKGLWSIKPSSLSSTHPSPSKLAKTEQFVGSSKSNKFHNPDCIWAKKIHPENEVWFKDAAAAKNRNYIPCSVCNPN